MSLRLLRPANPHQLLRPSVAYQHLRSFQTNSPSTLKPAAKRKDFAFAFDIDGVLLHSSTPLPTAISTLHTLTSDSIPFLLLTNGGGRLEYLRVSQLSRLLSTPLSTSQFVQSHTPYTLHVPRHTGKTVLVVGGTAQNCREIAESYGFEHVIIPADVIAAEKHAGVTPFGDVELYRTHAKALRAGETKVGAVFVFSDPLDWASDIQVILDVLLSRGGVLGTRRSQKEVETEGQAVDVFFSNPDLWWVNGYPLPRLGQGGFRAALEGVWKAATGGKGVLRAEAMGKPHQETYAFAEDVLVKWMNRVEGVESGDPNGGGLKTVYMVGDNPASDIAGANGFKSKRGVEWVSCLVKSGVWREGEDTGGAKVVVDNVGEAVSWAFKREMVKA